MADMRIRQRRGILSLMAFVGLVLASCTPAIDSSKVDRSFLTKQPCAPPCWYGLKIDQSNAAEVYATLKQLSFVDQTTIKEWGANWLRIRIQDIV